MTDDIHDLSRHERADIVLRADLRGRLPEIIEGGASRSPSPVVAKAVLFVLDSFPPDRCFPGEELIADRACTSTRTLRRAIGSLIAGGFVEARERKAKGARNRSSRIYRIRYDMLAALDPRAQPIADDELAPAQWAAPGQPRPNGPPAPAQWDSQPRPNGPPRQDIKRPESVDQHHAPAAGGGPPAAPPARRCREEVIHDIREAGWIVDVTPALVRLGVSRRRIPELCRLAGSRDRILEVLEALRDRCRRCDDIRNPGGWIAKAIAEDWKPTPRKETPNR